MPTIECSIEIDAPQGKVFLSVPDYAMRPRDAVLDTAILLDGANCIKTGTRMRVKSGRWRFEIEFVQFKLPERATFVVNKCPPMFARVGGAWIIEPLAEQRSLLRYRCSFHSRWWLFPLLSNSWIKHKLSECVHKRLKGLKQYCEQ